MKRAPHIHKANREAVLSAATLNAPEVRFLVTNYYDAQEMRKRGDMQLRHLGDKTDPAKGALPVCLSAWTDNQAELEREMEKYLGTFARNHPVGRWMLAQHGIGPVIAAGLLAHIDIEEAPTVGHIWRYAGLDPSSEWKRGEIRPFNAQLKQLCWHAGQCFLKTYNSPDSVYGKLYKQRKELVVAKNEAGLYAERCKVFYTKSEDVRKGLALGRLPASNLDAQARRFAVKMFLSHLHAVMFYHHFGRAPVKPFAMSILGHVHELKIPNMEMFPGFDAVYYGIRRRVRPRLSFDEAAE